MELEILKWIIMTLGGIAVWFMKNAVTTAQSDIKNLKTDLDNMKRDYLHKDDFKDFKLELRSMFDEIKTDIRDLKHSTVNK